MKNKEDMVTIEISVNGIAKLRSHSQKNLKYHIKKYDEQGFSPKVLDEKEAAKKRKEYSDSLQKRRTAINKGAE